MSEALQHGVSAYPARSLARWTTARVDLGRAGAAMPTAAMLEFTLDHALARDAVHTALDTERLRSDLEEAGFASQQVWSQARSRPEYLRRPDLGRLVAAECEPVLRCDAPEGRVGLVVVLGDGLSSEATARHAVPLLREMRDGLTEWVLRDVLIATQARVALGDQVGEAMRAEAVLVLIGERPGLKSTNSLGAYLTYRPRVGCTDAERNCVSNIRQGGLLYSQAAHTLLHLLRGARAMGATGVGLKDSSGDESLALGGVAPARMLTE